ncbi:MAG: hypothetical protein K9L58_05610 [Candidatus Omnitrophica bacterium]|nr:hypothetical protein [Candidatus Omnitrophota bacterium]
MKRFIIFILLIPFFLIGCISAANRYYLQEKLPAKDLKDVEVLRKEPTRSYIVIADLQATGATTKYMRKQAAGIGADAVIVTPAGGWYSRSESWAGKDEYSNTYSTLIGVAIKYKEK